jgi:hypothetical protein
MDHPASNRIKYKCTWCGRPIDAMPMEIEFKEATKYATAAKVHVCNETCGKTLIENEKKYEGKAPVFIAMFVIFIITGAFSVILGGRDSVWLYPGIAGTILFGITVYFLPFVTPQTVRLFGYKKGQLIGRVAGMALIILGVAIAGFLYIKIMH